MHIFSPSLSKALRAGSKQFYTFHLYYYIVDSIQLYLITFRYLEWKKSVKSTKFFRQSYSYIRLRPYTYYVCIWLSKLLLICFAANRNHFFTTKYPLWIHNKQTKKCFLYSKPDFKHWFNRFLIYLNKSQTTIWCSKIN